jgi:hypothetical protein
MLYSVAKDKVFNVGFSTVRSIEKKFTAFRISKQKTKLQKFKGYEHKKTSLTTKLELNNKFELSNEETRNFVEKTNNKYKKDLLYKLFLEFNNKDERSIQNQIIK